jgi:hypothetical protein
MHAPINRRKEPRIPVIKLATVIANGTEKAIDCNMIDLSNGGACLWGKNINDAPDEFDLYYDSIVRRCRVRWRRENKVGVAFDG